MAANAPNCIEVSEYQFKIHKKSQVFKQLGELRSDINLLATASNYGLIFVGDPSIPELKVIRLENLVNSANDEEKLLARSLQLPGIPHCIAVSCDGAMLAINYTLNGSSFLSVYNVTSFVSGNVSSKFNIRISPEENVQILQILWNPVTPNTLAIVLNNGGLGMYNLKDTGYEFYSIDKQEKVKCACWSPKGKQIVLGFPAGKLVQYKPDLKIARSIPCPDYIHNGPFNTIAVQWLSNYQFAAVFLQEGEDMSPALYIINAPKTGNPIYINYSDISYSQCGPRNSQVFLIHIQPWNILLMTTSNSMEAGILGTKETGDNPTWVQYTLVDEARLEMPLTSDKQDTFPIGIVLETGCTHQLTIAENKIPVMPMIHVLSTHGLLISFDFLNLTPGAPGICSPPQPIADMSGLNLFRPIDELLGDNNPSSESQSATPTQASDFSFVVPSGATSTPAADRKPKSIFGDKPAGATFGNFPATTTTIPFGSLNANTAPAAPAFNKPIGGLGGFFASQTTSQSQSVAPINQPAAVAPFGTKSNMNFDQTAITGIGTTNSTSVPSMGTIAGQPLAQSKSVLFGTQDNSTGKPLVQKQDSLERSKPLYTIPPTYTGSPQQQQHQPQFQESKIDQSKVSNSTLPTDSDVHEIIKELIKTQIDSFEMQLRELSLRSKDIDISIGNIEESKECTKRLNDLKELTDRAVEKDMESDIQMLRHSLNESFAMIAEVKSKLNIYKNPELSELAASTPLNQTNRRQMAKLKSLIAVNDAQLQVVQQQIDAQWANYQDLVRQNSRTKMHIPGLEGIYQTLTKQKDILARERIKINYIKSKLGIKGLLDKKASEKADVNVESLVDSILSMSLADQVKTETSRLNDRKLNAIRDTLKGRKIIKIKPQRPDRVRLNSEVIMEAKIRTVPAPQREGAATKPEKMEKLRIQNEKGSIAKPTATKATPNMLLGVMGLQQIKKVEPKPINIIQQPVQVVPQKPVAKVPTAFNTGEPFANQQQVKPFAVLTQQSNNNFMGNIFGKPADIAMSQQSVSSTAPGPFAGIPNSSNVSVFATQKVETGKPLGQTLPFGENKALQPSHPSADTKVSDVPKPGSGILSFGTRSDKLEAAKEQTPISFTPKVIGGEARLNLGFTFANKTSEATDQNLLSEDKTPGGNITDTKSEPNIEQSSVFSPVNLAISNEQKTTEPSKIDIIKIPSSTTITPSGFLNLSSKPTGVFGSKETTITAPSFPSMPNTTITSIAAPASTAVSVPLSTNVTSSTSFPSNKAAESANITSSDTSQKSGDNNSNVAPPSQSVFDLSALSMPTKTTSSSSPTTPEAIATTPPSTKAITTFSFVTSTTTTPATSTATPSTESTEAPTALTPKSDSSADNLLENLNICKPTALENAPKTTSTNIFGGSLFGSTVLATSAPAVRTKSIFDSATTTASTTSVLNLSTSSQSSPFVTSFTTDTSANANQTQTSTAPVTAFPQQTAVTSSGWFGSPSSTATTAPFGSPPTTWSHGSQTTSTVTTSAFGTPVTTSSIFQSTPALAPTTGFGGTPTASTVPFGETKTTTPFAGGTSTTPSIFATSTATASAPLFGGTTPSTSASLFGTPTAASTSASIFGGANTSPFTNVSGTTSSSIFGGTPSSTTSGSIFGGIPKPDQSLFAATSTATVSPFGANNTGASLFRSPTSNQQISGDNIFGSSTGQMGFGMQPATSAGTIFGGATAVSQPSSPFGGVVTSEAPTNVFAPTSQGHQATGGSLFAPSSFGNAGQTTSSIFGGGGGTATSTFGQNAASPFAAGAPQQSSPFGGGTSAFGQSGFGNSSPFAQQTTGFGSTSPGGSFAQGGASVAQTGFGSPNASFPKPTFGGPPTFGATPAFGGAPMFGGVSSFAAQKSPFSNFGPSNTGAFSPPAQKNALFESLGSTDSGLSFGNIAQNANVPTTKPQFGGSQFSTWR